MAGSRRVSVADGILLFCLLAVIFTQYISMIRRHPHPQEDAAILMRYAEHMAEGHGIVWNIGARPVDGATDFLYLILVASVARFGLGVESSARIVGCLSHALTVCLIYFYVRHRQGAPRWAALLSAVYLTLGPGMAYVEAGFGTPLFALAAASAWCLAIELKKRPASQSSALWFSVCALITALIRPEGLLLALFMVGALVYFHGIRKTARIVYCMIVVVGGIGGVYFLWRWSYFGYPLPNPYYIKGGGHLYWHGLRRSISESFRLTAPYLPFLLAGLLTPRTRRLAGFALIPVIGFTIIWVLLSPETNYLARFQYAVVPIVLITWWPVSNALWSVYRDRDVARGHPSSSWVFTAPLVILCSSMLVVTPIVQVPRDTSNNSLYDVGIRLRDLRYRNYTMVVTEAGLLPFCSGWKAVDAWGLNDAWIAHHGKITESYIRAFNPEIIMFSGSPFRDLDRRSSDEVAHRDEWYGYSKTTTELQAYAENHGYQLAAIEECSASKAHHFYVRRDCQDRDRIVQAVRLRPYYLDGYPCTEVSGTGIR